MAVNLQIKGLNELRARINSMPKNLVARVDVELDGGAKDIATEAKTLAPKNLGGLQQGIGSGKEGELSYEVFSNADYSAFVEFGTGANVEIPAGLEEYAEQFKGAGNDSPLSAKEAIFAWCKDKGIDEKLWYPIYVSIMVNGIHPQPFFFPAKDHQEPIIVGKVEKAIQQVVQ